MLRFFQYFMRDERALDHILIVYVDTAFSNEEDILRSLAI